MTQMNCYKCDASSRPKTASFYKPSQDISSKNHLFLQCYNNLNLNCCFKVVSSVPQSTRQKDPLSCVGSSLSEEDSCYYYRRSTTAVLRYTHRPEKYINASDFESKNMKDTKRKKEIKDLIGAISFSIIPKTITLKVGIYLWNTTKNLHQVLRIKFGCCISR